jgi:hypothetical protein
MTVRGRRGTPGRHCRATVLAVLTTALALVALPATAASAKPTAAQIQAAQRWYSQLTGDLAPLGTSLVSGLQSASQWQAGTVTAAQAASAFGTDASDLEVVLGTVEDLKPLPGQRAALGDYVAAVTLYLQAFLVDDAATHLAPGALVAQLQRSFQRIRHLGDVTFDQGTTQLAPLLGSALAGPDVRAARQIPDWVSLSLAPGQPLESSWSGTRDQPSGSQSPARWAAAVRDDGAPSSSSLRSALRRSSTATRQLSRIAWALQRAEVRLDRVSGPSGAPETSALLRLGLLVDAEAALAGEASALAGVAPDTPLAGVASALASVGGGLRAGSPAD